MKRTGARTSRIADPPNGRLPPLTPEAQKTAAADREFRLALVQSTDTCKKRLAGSAGWKYDPTTSPRRAEAAPRYNTARMNRNDGPADSSLPERCLTAGPIVFGGNTGSFRRIVQTPGGISMFYGVGQGQGWQRNIVMDGSPHLRPASASGSATRRRRLFLCLLASLTATVDGNGEVLSFLARLDCRGEPTWFQLLFRFRLRCQCRISGKHLARQPRGSGQNWMRSTRPHPLRQPEGNHVICNHGVGGSNPSAGTKTS
jgi:hypothetical protein